MRDSLPPVSILGFWVLILEVLSRKELFIMKTVQFLQNQCLDVSFVCVIYHFGSVDQD